MMRFYKVIIFRAWAILGKSSSGFVGKNAVLLFCYCVPIICGTTAVGADAGIPVVVAVPAVVSDLAFGDNDITPVPTHHMSFVLRLKPSHRVLKNRVR
jgi:hypothetical protein